MKPKIRRVVDLGCGAGGITTELDTVMKFEVMIGCDLSGSILKTTKNLNRNLLLVKADCEQVPLRARSAELVLLIDLIEHLKYPKRAIAEAARITTRLVVIRTPIQDCLYHNLRKSKNMWLSEWKAHCGHLHRFTVSYLIRLLERNGLRVIRIMLCEYPFSLIKGSLLSRIMSYVLPRLIPGSIYSRFFPAEYLILAKRKTM